MSSSFPAPEHPLLVASAAAGQVLDGVAGVDPMFLSVGEKARVLGELTRLLARVAALRASVVAGADDLAVETSHRSAGTWLAVETRTSRHEAVAAQRLGRAVRDRWTRVGDAVAAGSITWEQTDVLVRALDDLPGDLEPELAAKAEAHLVTEAGHFGPRELARLGRKVLEVVAPDIADDHEHRLLLDQERRARAATRVSFRPRGDGSTDVIARLPDVVASRLRVYLDAYTSPRRTGLGGDVDRLPLGRLRGEAFRALLEHIPSQGLPAHGGTATSAMVTIDLHTLRTGLGLAESSAGDTITAAEARRLACTAGILPVVLDGRSEVLDLGRSRRLFSPGQRKALAIRDRTCRAEGCDIPAAWCEAHHAAAPWASNGRTDLNDGLLLCPFHHHRAHDAAVRTARLPDGRVRFNRRT